MSDDTNPTTDERLQLLHDLSAELFAPVLGRLGELFELLRDPEPVRAVPSDDWDVITVAVPATATMILGGDIARLRAVIVNTGDETVYVNRTAEKMAGAVPGIPLEAGASLQLDTKAPAYALAVATPSQLSIMVEWTNPAR